MTATPLQVVEAAYAAYERRDFEAVFRLLYVDVEILQTDLLPWGGLHRGHAGAAQFFKSLAEHTVAMPSHSHLFPPELTWQSGAAYRGRHA